MGVATDRPRTLRSGKLGHYQACLMENNNGLRKAVADILIACGWGTTVAESAEAALKAAKTMNVRYFIVDLDMGRDRPTEGLRAIEMLKSFSPAIFVAVYSSHLARLEDLAEQIKPDLVVQKTTRPGEIRQDTARIIEEFLTRVEANHRRMLEQFKLEFPRPSNDRLSSAGPVQKTEERLMPITINQLVFDEFCANPTWVRSNAGKYATFVDGQLSGLYDRREEALVALRTRPASERMIARIGPPVAAFDFPSLHDLAR